ncbi:MAG: KH domain-containing protein, partial [Armatimonadetes bacterium]|nr:KH domain-containing protein [Armatimonadota bacterium]
EVSINEVPGRRLTVYEIAVADRDRGKVIGKQGRIANAIRTVAKAGAGQLQQHVAVEIIT